MTKPGSQIARSQIALGALAGALALVSLPAFAQNAGPGGAYFGAGSGPQTGGTPAAMSASSASSSRKLYDRAAPQESAASTQAGPSGAYFSAGTSPQTGGTPAPMTASRSASNVAPQPSGNGPAGPGGANYGAASSPQTGR